jgi:hypothetical protein
MRLNGLQKNILERMAQLFARDDSEPEATERPD